MFMCKIGYIFAEFFFTICFFFATDQLNPAFDHGKNALGEHHNI